MEKQREEQAYAAVSDVAKARAVDEEAAQHALQQLGSQATNQQARQTIKIREDSIKTIMLELELTRKEAEQALIDHNGDLVAALTYLVAN